MWFVVKLLQNNDWTSGKQRSTWWTRLHFKTSWSKKHFVKSAKYCEILFKCHMVISFTNLFTHHTEIPSDERSLWCVNEPCFEISGLNLVIYSLWHGSTPILQFLGWLSLLPFLDGDMGISFWADMGNVTEEGHCLIFVFMLLQLRCDVLKCNAMLPFIKCGTRFVQYKCIVLDNSTV